MGAYYSTFNFDAFVREEFALARRRAARRRWFNLGRNTQMKSFGEHYQLTGTGGRSARGIQTIPVDQIAGSASDNQSFDDQFNPRHQSVEDRWIRLYAGFINGNAIPPIDVYQIGDAYYVEDGHHRVSVARAIGQAEIEANVIQIEADPCDQNQQQPVHYCDACPAQMPCA